MKPLVSILIPAYEAGEWVAQTIRSALAQTWSRKEIIIIDDGSRDDTYTIASGFASKSVCVKRREHMGAAAARNHALALSQGDYIQWLDADDVLAPDKIEKQLAAAESFDKRTLLSAAWGRFYYRLKGAVFENTALWEDLVPIDWMVRKLELNLFMQTASWLTSREISSAVGPWDTRLLADDDGEYFCRVVMASEHVKFVPESKVFWRNTGMRGLSYIGFSTAKIEAHFLSMASQIARLRSLEDSPRVRTACLRYLQNFMIYVYPERAEMFQRAQALGRDLGGVIVPPDLSWKYAYFQKVFGWHLAKRMRFVLPNLKRGLNIWLDKKTYQLQNSQSQEVDGAAVEETWVDARTGD